MENDDCIIKGVESAFVAMAIEKFTETEPLTEDELMFFSKIKSRLLKSELIYMKNSMF